MLRPFQKSFNFYFYFLKHSAASLNFTLVHFLSQWESYLKVIKRVLCCQVDRLDPQVVGGLAKILVGGEREGWLSWQQLYDSALDSHEAVNTHRDNIMQASQSVREFDFRPF